ncbi:MAG: alpha/beta hydrolase [Polyangiaceae bacterium]|nr:alpha/beta hydrolase [Polyangiaceae bacterium]
MQTSSFEWTADDGKRIVVHVFSPDSDGAPRAVVHVVHGMSEHGARYARVAEVLTASGFVVVAHDQRGHGKTATDDELGFFGSRDGWGRALADIRGLLAHTRTTYAGAPQAIIGHSMGSFLTQRIMSDEGPNLAAVVLSATNGPPNALARSGVFVARAERARLGDRGKSRLLQALSFDGFNRAFRPNRTAFDWLSRDDAEVDKYIADDRCGFAASASLWVQLLEALPGLLAPDVLARIPKTLPVYVLAGAEDPVHDKTKNLKGLLSAYAQAGLSDVTYRAWPGARHEVFNETNRAQVVAEMHDWLAQKIPARQ